MGRAFERNRADGTRYCSTCRGWRPIESFASDPSRRDGRAYTCRDCNTAGSVQWRLNNPERQRRNARARHLLRTFGLTEERFAAMLAEQDGHCAICPADQPGGSGTWHIDHDRRCCPGTRSCGQCVRRLLCSNCNRGLGHFRDDPALLRAAADYLEGASVR